MKVWKSLKRWKVFLICILMAALMLPGSAMAAGIIDIEQPLSLTLSCRTDDGTALVGQTFEIYRVADMDAYGELTITDGFKDYEQKIRITGKDDEAWRTLASTLEGYVRMEAASGNLKPADSGKTDAQGNLVFPTSQNSLKPGLYLVIGQYFVQDGYSYTPTPFMALLPGQDMEENQWIYSVTAKPKQETEIVESPPTVISRKVLKVWDDDGKEASRPAYVTVQLLRDGQVYDTVRLTAANSWRWSWNNLSDGYNWNVVEEVSNGYNVQITREGITFVVKNTYTGSGGNNPGEQTGSKLPQTGMLWWPVPVMAALGILLLGAGILVRRREAEKDAEGDRS